MISANTGLNCTQIVFSGRDTATLKALIMILRGANDAQKSPHVVGLACGRISCVFSTNLDIDLLTFLIILFINYDMASFV